MPVRGGLDELRIRWNRAESISSSVRQLLLHQPSFTDVTLICAADGAILKAHQFLLARYSPLLARTFGCGCKSDGCCFRKEDATVLLDDTGRTAAQSLLDLIYAGQSSFTSQEDKEAFHALAARLGVALPGTTVGGVQQQGQKRKLHEVEEEEEEEQDKSRYRCYKCSFEAPGQKELLSHSLRCTRDGKVKDDGGVVMTSKFSFELITVKQEPLDKEELMETCKYCGDPCADKEGLLRHFCEIHFRTHLQKAFGHLPACPSCGKTFPDDDDSGQLLWHLGVDHRKVEKFLDYCAFSDRDLSCPVCQDDFESPEILVSHLAVEHYRAKLEKMYPAAKCCPVCKAEIASESSFLGHLVGRHRGVIFKVVPPPLAQQLRRLRSISAPVASITEDGEPLDSLANPNLICPICDRSFHRERELKRDLALHYLPALRDMFGGEEVTACHLCPHEGDGNRELMLHIAIEHDQLAAVVPVETKRLLRGSGIFTTLSNGESYSPAVFSGATSSMQCPACKSLFNRKPCFDRHVITSHLRQTILPYVNCKQCLICHSSFSDTRQALVHVGRMHGFLNKYLRKNEGDNSAAFKSRQKFSKLNGKSSFSSACGSSNSIRAPPSGVDSAGVFVPSRRAKLTCPLCQNSNFKKWCMWKKHLYSHVRDRLQRQYSYVSNACPYCPRKFASHAETVFHIGTGHNKVFGQLSPEVQSRLKSDGLTSNPMKRIFLCPMCTDERKIVGQYNFTYHLFSHWETKIRDRYGRYGNSCFFCRRTAKDLHDNLRHIALDHNKLVDFMPEEVVQDLTERGVFEKKKSATEEAAVSENGLMMDVEGADEDEEQGDYNHLLLPDDGEDFPKLSEEVDPIASESAPASPQVKVEDDDEITSPGGMARNMKKFPKPCLLCPVCSRTNFQTRQDLQTHLMAVHYKKEFLRLYGKFGMACPYCKRRYPSQVNCLRHIASYHNKLKRVLPDNVLQVLIQNGVLFENNRMDSATTYGNGNQQNEFAAAKMPGLHSEKSDSVVVPTKMTNVSCPVCAKNVLRGKLMIHLTKHFRKELRNAYPDAEEKKCKLCFNNFVSRDAFVSHMGSVHGQVVDFLRDEDRDAVVSMGIKLPTKFRNRRKKSLSTPTPPCPEEQQPGSAESLSPARFEVLVDMADNDTASSVLPCPVCTKEFTLVRTWRAHLLKHFSAELLDHLPMSGSLNCRSCNKDFDTKDTLLRHLAFSHYSILPLVDPETRSLVLSSATAAFPPTDDEDGKRLNCCKCRFETGDLGELSTHLVCHFYEELKSKYGAGDDCNCSKCDFRGCSAFDLVVHMGVEHMKLLSVATREVNRLFLSSVTVNAVGNVTKDLFGGAFIKMKRKVTVPRAVADAGLTMEAVDPTETALQVFQ